MSLEFVAADLERHLEGVNREMTVDLYFGLWEATPVRTGYARSRWTARYRRGRGSITNDTDYLIYLNAGSSMQAPRGFIQAEIAKVLANDYEEGQVDDRRRVQRGPTRPNPNRDARPPGRRA